MNGDSMLDSIEAAISDLSSARQAFRAALEMARAQLPPQLQLVGGPGAALPGGVRPEDLLVRINPGEPVTPLVGRIMSETSWSPGGPSWDAEQAGPGYYARVSPVYGPDAVAASRYRRVLDYRGRVPANHIVLRPTVIVSPRPTVLRASPSVVRPSPIGVRPRPIYGPAAAPVPAPQPAEPAPPSLEPEPDQPLVGDEPKGEQPEPGVDEPGEQTCANEGTEAEQVNWWDPAIAEDELVATAPAELRSLLAYLHVSWPTFADQEGRYFAALGEHLRREGIIAAGGRFDRTNYADAVKEFQAKRRLEPDGLPGEDVLWELQRGWADSRRLGVVRVDADKHPNSEGFDQFRLRSDIVERYNAFRGAVRSAGGIVTSAGSLRDLEAEVRPGRSSTSMHYSGLALDLATDSGMQNPERDAYIVTQEGNRWRVWCKSETALPIPLSAVVWSRGATRVQVVMVKAFDFTAIARRHGFSPIGPRGDFPGNYLSAEWWHFQCEEPLTPYVSQFGIELLSIEAVGRVRYDEATLSRQPLWANRKRIFKRGKNGWW